MIPVAATYSPPGISTEKLHLFLVDIDIHQARTSAGGGAAEEHEDIDEVDGCGLNRTWSVCSKPNGDTLPGLCDMAGNVWEFVADWYGPYSEAPNDGSARLDPTGQRLTRGGAFVDGAGRTRTGARTWIMEADQTPFIGLLVARDAR